jgi:outer membrane protease
MNREQLAMSKEDMKVHVKTLKCEKLNLKDIFSLRALRLCVVVFIMFYATDMLFCETNNEDVNKEPSYQFSTGISAGILYGTSFELVYQKPDVLLSELRWNMNPLFYLGTFLEISRKDFFERPGFYAKLDLKAGFPGKTGSMEDLDWLAADNTLSHFSLHDNFTNSAFLLDASLGYSIPFFSAFIITPQIALHYMHYKWIGRDGYYQYGDEIISGIVYEAWDDSIPKTYVHGNVVGYSQDWIIASFGLSLQYSFLKRFFIEGSFLFSPLISVSAVDVHYFTDVRYNDNSSGGYMLEPAFVFSFSFNEKMKLNAKASYRYINDSTGFSGYTLVGAEYEMWDAGITFCYKF